MADETINESQKRPILVLLASHWISMIGTALVTLAGFSWLFLLPTNVRGAGVSNPYIGILFFIILPAIFFAGLALIPIGVFLAKRRIASTIETLPDRKSAFRRTAIFFAVMTVANVIIGSQFSYRAVQHMDTAQFCGQSCHVMNPEFTAHQVPPHEGVECASCHIAPGATGWFHAKMAGTNQLFAVVFNTFPRPIESAMENNKLVSSADTCEQCHSRELVSGPRLRIITKYKDDEANTRNETVLMMMVGGGATGGIHGAHMGPGVHMRYAAADKKRQTIPWVEYQNTATGVKRTYLAADAKPDAVSTLPTFEMQCVDCHNRAAHSFEQADRALDGAMKSGDIATGLPFIKKTSLALLKADYKSGEEAEQKISSGLAQFYREKYPDVFAGRSNDIQNSARTVAAIYNRNVFPDLKVTWGTYPNNLGHTDFPGCFRCHDENHATADKKTISQDCTTCHNPLAVEEASPDVLKTLGLADILAKTQKQ
jgi:nitrate/TMAO reductase-like tetraheme cytochrome c subunit